MKSSLWAFQYAFLSLLLLIILHFPISLSVDDPKYSNCKLTFDCGNIKGVSYPFWGGSRPKYCGGPGFELVCTENGTSKLYISTQIYRVLNISEENQVLIIARDDIWDSRCIEKYPNSSLDFNYFNYIPNYVNLTLFSDCPMSIPGVFNCTQDGVTKGFQFQFTSSASNVEAPPATEYPKLGTCENSVVFTVLEESVRRYGLQNETGWTMPNIESVLREGFEVGYDDHDGGFCELCRDSDGECGYDWDLWRPICFCPTGQSQNQCPKVIVVVAFGILITVLATIVTCRLRKKSNTSIISWKNKEGNTKAVEDFFKDCELLAPKRYKYKDIKKMSNSFQDKIGQGGFGSVFKGKLPDGRVVAVKILSETKGDGNEFINEVACIGRTSHVNIVTLLGFCIDGPKRALVYEFMPNGSLEKFIYGERLLQTRHLGWEALYKVAVGIARGLEYLHRGCNTRIVHFDIKPHNILLNENFIPKIADFGLSKLSNAAQSMVSMTGARGTPGYIAPELVSRCIGEVSHKSDVYSYGMMVLEMVGGRKNVDVRVTNLSEIYFPPWIHKRLDMNEDLGLHGVTSLEDHEIARKMILVGLWCIQINPTNRPPMSKVLEMLEGSLEALQLPPKPYLSSPSIEEEGSALGISTLSDEDESSALGISTMSDEDESSALAQHI